MCGIFGIISDHKILANELNSLAHHAEQRGKDSSGLILANTKRLDIYREDGRIKSLLKRVSLQNASMAVGHSRLITNGMEDNQPITRDGMFLVHNGIVVNHDGLWEKTTKTRKQKTDSEIIVALASTYLDEGGEIEGIPEFVLSHCQGVVACALGIPKLGKLCLFSNNGSLYTGHRQHAVYFSSEKFPLSQISCESVSQVMTHGCFIDIPKVSSEPHFHKPVLRGQPNVIPNLGNNSAEEKALEFKPFAGKRCSRCILPETFPFIKFDENGVCNYCKNYKKRNRPKPVEELFELVEPYRRKGTQDCIIPFSGGRDSCYSLHLIVNELKMKPITYTYDWGMVTDLGRRNISRMCGELGIENIIFAADIHKKRENIRKNFKAWLKAPNLGMVSILTAGDKHFFRHVETVKKQTGVSLNLWGVNPLEVTHFKAGFLGVKPDFEEERVYYSSAYKQLRYQWLRTIAMSKSPSYFNASLFDTLSGEYYRSFHRKTDYFHVFDYYRWDEQLIDDVLVQKYNWELAPDTNTTWRIGDGTAAMYNYIYKTVAGFSEHDTFRSNQIREGDLSREEALKLVEDENRPRYPNLKWYLDAISMDFHEVIKIVNAIPKIGGH